MEEMLEDTMEGLEDDDMEDEAEEEVDKVLYELTAGKLNSVFTSLYMYINLNSIEMVAKHLAFFFSPNIQAERHFEEHCFGWLPYF